MRSPYHFSVIRALKDSGICSDAQFGEVEVLLAGLTGECAADAPQIWAHVARRILLPDHDFAVHKALAAVVYGGWPAGALGRPPLWLPHLEEARRTNVARFMAGFQGNAWWWAARSGRPGAPASLAGLQRDWAALQALSWEDPEAFWPAVLGGALRVAFDTPPHRALLRHPSDPDRCRWLPGARLNAAAAALACPLAPPGAPALVWAAEGAPAALRTMGRQQLVARARHLAACVRVRFPPGSRLAIYMPMTPSAVLLYLGVVLAGCVVVSVADSFSPAELATRLALAGAVGVFTQDVVPRGGRSLPLYGKVLASGTAAAAVVLRATGEEEEEDGGGEGPSPGLSPAAPPLRPGDMPYGAFRGLVSEAEGAAFRHHVADAYDITNVLFSSGTTGEPKAIPWSHVMPLRCAVDAWAQLDVRPGDVVAWPSSLGWMMGPWLLYGALLNGATVALYTGAPLGRDFCQFVATARVTQLGLVPSIARAWRAGGCTAGLDWSAVRAYGSTGEASGAEDCHWLMGRAAGYRPVIEYCGGTEIGGGYISGTLLHPCAPATFTTPTLGTRLVLLPPDTATATATAGEAEQGSAAAAGGGGGGGGGGAVASGGCQGMAAEAAGAGGGAWPAELRVYGDGGWGGGGGGAAEGEVALAMPMLGVSQRLLNRDHGKVYYAGMPLYGSTGLPLRRHGDEMARLPYAAVAAGGGGGSCYVALGRCDDTMNLGGIKVSSLELERCVVGGVPGVAEAAAVGVAPPGGGPERLVLCLVLGGGAGAGGGGGSGDARGGAQGGGEEGGAAREGGGARDEAALLAACQAAVRSRLNPLFKVHRVAVLPALPRNASNKVMRRTLRDALAGGAEGAEGAGAAPRARL